MSRPRAHALFQAQLRQAERFLPRGQRALRDLQIEVQVAQLEIGTGDLANHRDQDSAPGPLGGEQLSAGGLGLAAHAGPRDRPHSMRARPKSKGVAFWGNP